jgi:hypothetical protein
VFILDAMMRIYRLLAPLIAALAVLLALAVAGAEGAAASAGSASTAATGPTGATTTAALTASLSACHTDAVPANRYAIFVSQTVAQSVPETLSMSVDFELQERSEAAGAFLPVKATGFGVWVTSQPRVGIFTYNHEVTALPAPAAFRVLVKARWIGRRRRVLHTATALSPVCVQPLIAPDLVIGRITKSAVHAGSVQYSVEVRNAGNAAAGPFAVSLTLGAQVLPAVTIAGLAPGATSAAVFTGPVCTAGNTLTAEADSAHAIQEPADARRARTVACPIT